jgi:tetrapyrrole methylase family protein / MazG family protein
MKEMQRVIDIMSILRSENGCNWDKKQTHHSLLPYVIEETYEVVDAIQTQDYASLKEELGDLLFQIVFHAQITKEEGRFDLEDIARTLADKLVFRHPHIFGNPRDLSSEQVLQNWDKIKAKEKADKGIKMESILDGIPKSLPGLARAVKLQEVVSKVGFDWTRAVEVLEKIEEEIGELKKEIRESKQDPERLEDELGDVLFSSVNLARFLKISPEAAMGRANKKFEARFRKLEIIAKAQSRELKDLSIEELDELWNKAKETE